MRDEKTEMWWSALLQNTEGLNTTAHLFMNPLFTRVGLNMATANLFMNPLFTRVWPNTTAHLFMNTLITRVGLNTTSHLFMNPLITRVGLNTTAHLFMNPSFPRLRRLVVSVLPAPSSAASSVPSASLACSMGALVDWLVLPCVPSCSPWPFPRPGGSPWHQDPNPYQPELIQLLNARPMGGQDSRVHHSSGEHALSLGCVGRHRGRPDLSGLAGK